MNSIEKQKAKGRMDILVQALCDKGLEYLEQKNGLSGLKDNLSPLIGKHLKEIVGNTAIEIPEEAVALYNVIRMNRKTNGNIG